MLGLPPSVRIYFATGLVDMRNGIDGLRTIVEQVLVRDPNQGHLFVFVGKSRDKLKILFWDKNGYVIYFKRLERGRFRLPIVVGKKEKIRSRTSDRRDRIVRWTVTAIALAAATKRLVPAVSVKIDAA